MEKTIVSHNEEEKVEHWEPYLQYTARKFIFYIQDFKFKAKIFWNKEYTKEQIYQVAKDKYEEFKDILPIAHLNYYKPE